MKVVAKSLRISPKKLNLVAELIRGRKALEAMEMLTYTPKKGAKLLHKAVKSAVANATNNFKQEANNLVIKEVVVTKAQTFKRWVPISRGRVHPILKRNSHLSITVGVQEAEVKETKTTKKAAPKAEKTASPAKPATPAKTEEKAKEAEKAPKTTKSTKAK